MTLFRIPIGGWKKCVHEAAAFETAGEYAAAKLLDGASVIVWWLRNDPPILRIPSPMGYFMPDIVYLAHRDNGQCHGALEIKGDIFWDGEGSEARHEQNRWNLSHCASSKDSLNPRILPPPTLP